MSSHISQTGFGLIGIMLVVFIMLAIAFGFQKLRPTESSPASDTSLGTYQPITPDGLSGQLEAGYQAKDNAQATVKNLQNRVSSDASGSE